MNNEEEIFFENKMDTYVDGLYFITTTMTQVGYGDINAWMGSGTGKGVYSMITVMLTQFTGILGFSIIKDQVFNAKKVQNIKEIVDQTAKETEGMLFRIDQVKRIKRENKNMT